MCKTSAVRLLQVADWTGCNWEGKGLWLVGKKPWEVWREDKVSKICWDLPSCSPLFPNHTACSSWSMRDRGQADPSAPAHRFPETQESPHPAYLLRSLLQCKAESFSGKVSTAGCIKMLIQCPSCSPMSCRLKVADDAELVSHDSCHSFYFHVADLCRVLHYAFHGFSSLAPFPCPNSAFSLFFFTVLS